MKAKVTLVLTMDEATVEDFMAWMGWPKEELTCQGAMQKDFTEEDVKKASKSTTSSLRKAKKKALKICRQSKSIGWQH